jgi:flagellar biosynthesis/type III secretory pathway protein FliH
MSTAAANDDFDNPWKEMLEHAFPELMAFYFPDAHARIDWMMRLPDALEQALWNEIQAIEGERKMAYVTSVERLAIQRGQQEGEAKGRAKGRVEGQAELVARLLTKHFGTLSAEIHARLGRVNSDQLERWGERLLDADSLDCVFDDH